jgi:hypothetical protein
MVTLVGYSVAGRSRGRVVPCAVCTWHVETRSAGFLVEPQNQGRRFVSGLASKSLGWFLRVWPQNQWQRFLAVRPQNLLLRFSLVFVLKTSGDGFLQFGLKTGGDSFSRFGLKTVVGFFVEPQNQGGGGFLGFGLKTGSSGLVISASKSLRRFLGLGLKTRQASVCRLRHKTDGGRSAWDTHRDLAACFAWKQV